MLISKIEQQLIEVAKVAKKNAYTVASNFPVGAAVLTVDGEIYPGCNTESVVSGLGVCAERSAIDHAICHGKYNFKTIAVTSNLDAPIYPCGMCRQYIAEFSQVVEKDIEILLIGKNDQIIRTSIYELIQPIFGPKDLNVDLSAYKKEIAKKLKPFKKIT